MRALCLLASIFAAGCGRFGYDELRSERPDAAVIADDAPIDATLTPATMSYVGSAVANRWGPATTDTFNVQATKTGNLFVLSLVCDIPPQLPASVAVTAPGWTFTQLDPIVRAPAADFYATTVTAIAPNTDPVDITVTWSETCGYWSHSIGDQLSSDAATTFVDSHVQTTGTGNCAATLTPTAANPLIWASCFNLPGVTGIGAGYTMGSDDMNGDWTQYRATTNPAGTSETVTMTADATSMYIMHAVAISAN